MAKKKEDIEKGTNAEIELRIATVYEMVVKGCSKKYILRYCAENFNIETRQTEHYLKRVHDDIKENYGEKYKEDLIEKQLAQLDNLYVKNYTIEDFRECRNVIESKSKLLGLNAPSKLTLEGGDKPIQIIPPIININVVNGDKHDD